MADDSQPSAPEAESTAVETNTSTPVVETADATPVTPSAPETPAQPQPQVVQQYVVTQQSLQGLGGWLVFFLVVFALMGIAYIMIFTRSISGLGNTGAEQIVSLLFTPILAIASVAAAALIALQRRLAVLVSLSVLGLSALYNVVNIIVAFTSHSYSASETAPIMVGTILATLIFHGLLGLYFVVSKRVKQTLVH